jgi:hypothetical protein
VLVREAEDERFELPRGPPQRVCCVQRKVAVPQVWKKRWLHGECELGECGRHAAGYRNLRCEFVVSAAEVLHEGMSSGDHGGGPESV